MVGELKTIKYMCTSDTRDGSSPGKGKVFSKVPLTPLSFSLVFVCNARGHTHLLTHTHTPEAPVIFTSNRSDGCKDLTQRDVLSRKTRGRGGVRDWADLRAAVSPSRKDVVARDSRAEAL